MNIQCAICHDALENSQDINTIPCGHVFHFVCLLQWFEKSPTCPECRKKIPRGGMTKIFFNYANIEMIKEDSFTLQQKVDSLSFQLRLKDTEASKSKQEIVTLRRQNAGLRDEVKRAESQIHEKISVIYALKEQAAVLKTRSIEYDRLKERNEGLERTLATYDNVKFLVSASSEEVEKMLGTNIDVTTLTTYIAILKRQLTLNLEKRKELRGIIRNLQSDVQTLKMKRDTFSQDYIKRIEELEEELTICKNENESLKALFREIKEKENQMRFHEEYTEDSNSGSEYKISRKRDIDYKENSDTIPKKAKKSQDVFKLHVSPNKYDSDTSTSKITKENTQDSPYLPTKSKGILNVKVRVLSGNRSSNRIPTTRNSSVLKNPEPSSKVEIADKESVHTAFDGLGGHSKVDEFPLPKNASNKLKRSLGDSNKSKKVKLDADRNNKMDDYIINLT